MGTAEMFLRSPWKGRIENLRNVLGEGRGVERGELQRVW